MGVNEVSNTITLVKGKKVTENTIKAVKQFIKSIDEKASVDVSSDLICLDIPDNAVQIIWADGTEMILSG